MRALRLSQGAKARVDRTGLLTLRKDVEIVVKGKAQAATARPQKGGTCGRLRYLTEQASLFEANLVWCCWKVPAQRCPNAAQCGIVVPAAFRSTGFWGTPGKISLNKLSMLMVERRSVASCRCPGPPRVGGKANPWGVLA